MNSLPPYHPHIRPHHWHEWVIGSSIDPEIAALNLYSLSGSTAYDYLLYSNKLPRRNDGRLSSGLLRSYEHIEAGGWWSSGVDVLSPTFDASLWGSFKPDMPRLHLDNQKAVKYEHPPKVATEIFALRVPWAIGAKIAKRNNHDQAYCQRLLQAVRSSQRKVQSQEESRSTGKNPCLDSSSGSNERTSGRGFGNSSNRPKQTGSNHSSVAPFLVEEALSKFGQEEDQEFWRWTLKTPEMPLLITEGAKKAGSLLTAGYAAIALPGVYNGYRQPKDEQGNKIGKPKLIPQLEAFTGAGREVVFVFDSDTKPKTVANVRKAILTTGKLLQQQGCQVSVITWSYPEKGIDDLMAARGAECFHALYNDRISLEEFELLELLDLSPYVNLRINQRYLGSVSSQQSAVNNNQTPLMTDLSAPPDAKLIALKSAKGTGKTEWLTRSVEKALANGQRVLVASHREQLAIFTGNRFSIDYRRELRTSQTKGVFGYSLCVDSLHPKGNPPFNPEHWEGAVVVIDEVEQVIWHLLNSNTCLSHRVAILKCFKELLQTVVSTGGQIYIADADLSPLSLRYIQQLIGYPVTTWVVENTYNCGRCFPPSNGGKVYRPNQGKRQLFTYEGHDPSQLVADLVQAISDGEKPLIMTGAQKLKSKWGTQNLESYLKKKFPQKRILRIDSESVSNPEHPAYGCMGNLNAVLPLYDIVIASPTIETGVSIDIKGHFTSVWAIAQGTQTVEAVCQALARLRDDVPRHLWASERGLEKVGNGATFLKALLNSQHKLCKANIQLLMVADADDEFTGLDTDFQPESLNTWAKRACLVNRGMRQYRESIIKKLLKEGYEINPHQREDEEEVIAPDEVKAEVKETQQENYQLHCEAVAAAETPSPSEQSELERRQAKTEPERQRQRKGELVKLYGDEITPALVEKDDLGWYAKLRLHYYLTIGAQFLTERDKRSLLKMIKAGEGSVFKPDVNKQLRGAKTKTLEIINLTQFLDPEREFTSESLADWQKTLISQRYDILTLTGISISPDKNETPIQLAQRILSQLFGLKLECIGKRGERGSQIRVYRGCWTNPDGRQEIFERWLERERLSVEQEAQAFTAPAPSKNVADDTVATLSINTYIPTETVDTKQGDTEAPPQKLDALPKSQPPNQQTEPPSSRTLQTGESVLIYTPIYEDRFKGRIRGIIQKVAQHATDCWEVLVDGGVRKVWEREWLFPATEGKGFDST